MSKRIPVNTTLAQVHERQWPISAIKTIDDDGREFTFELVERTETDFTFELHMDPLRSIVAKLNNLDGRIRIRLWDYAAEVFILDVQFSGGIQFLKDAISGIDTAKREAWTVALNASHRLLEQEFGIGEPAKQPPQAPTKPESKRKQRNHERDTRIYKLATDEGYSPKEIEGKLEEENKQRKREGKREWEAILERQIRNVINEQAQRRNERQ